MSSSPAFGASKGTTVNITTTNHWISLQCAVVMSHGSTALVGGRINSFLDDLCSCIGICIKRGSKVDYVVHIINEWCKSLIMFLIRWSWSRVKLRTPQFSFDRKLPNAFFVSKKEIHLGSEGSVGQRLLGSINIPVLSSSLVLLITSGLSFFFNSRNCKTSCSGFSRNFWIKKP
jgi:hypothetical protein